MATIIQFSKDVEKAPEGDSGVTRKRSSKNLYVDFYYYGKRIVKSSRLEDTPENRENLRRWVYRQKEKIADGKFRFAEAFPSASAEEKVFFAQLEGWDYKPNPDDVLFKDYVRSWRKRFLTICRSESKRRDYEQVIDDWLLPHFGDRPFFQITGVALKEFIPKLVWRSGKKKGQPLSASRIRNILIPLRAIWDDACEENHWDLSNPFVYIKKHVPKRIKKHPKVFRFDEWMKIINNFDPYYLPVAEVMVMTGMIGSEIAGLRKEDIQGDKIVIQNSIVRKKEKPNLKTDYRARRLPITHALKKRLNIAMSRSKGIYLFTMESGRIFDVDSFRKNPWTSAFKKAKLQYKVPYTTRHTFAAWALTLRIDPNRLVNLMGHGSKEMVYEVYGNYVEGLETDAGKIFGYFGKDFLGLRENSSVTFTNSYGESW